MTDAIGVRRSPFLSSNKKVYCPLINKDGNYTYRDYDPTPSTRNRIARLARSKVFDVFRDRYYFVIVRKVTAADEVREK